MAINPVIADFDEMMGVRAQTGRWHDGFPVGVRRRIAGDQTALNRCRRRIIAGKVAGIDIDALDDALDAEADDAISEEGRAVTRVRPMGKLSVSERVKLTRRACASMESKLNKETEMKERNKETEGRLKVKEVTTIFFFFVFFFFF